MFPWTMTNNINKFTKLISLARRYIEKAIINGSKYYFQSKQEAVIIDMVGNNYGVNLGAENEWTKERKASASMTQAAQTEVLDALQMVLEISKDFVEKAEDEDDIDYWIDEETQISRSAAVILLERMKVDEEFLYETKNKVLYIANALGELQKFDPHRTESGKWRYSVRWRGIPFHLPATTEDSKKFEKKYFGVDRAFPVKTEWKVPDLHLQEIMEDAWDLYIFIDNHLSLLDGYEEFRSRQVF